MPLAVSRAYGAAWNMRDTLASRGSARTLTPAAAGVTLPTEEAVMQTVLPSEFKRGMVLMLDAAPHVIEEFHITGTAQTKHKLHTRLRHLKTGRIVERVFAENERVPVAEMQTRRVTYSYTRGDTHVFLDAETFEELELSEAQLGERRWFLKEN